MGRRDHTLLVVDDDPDIREALRDMLLDEGYEAAAASNGAAALDYLRSDERRPSLIFLDWNMPQMSGSELMRALAEEPALAGIPVVLLTADMRVDDKARAHAFAAYLKKPIDFEQFFALLDRYCPRV